MRSKSVPLRIPEHLLDLATLCSKEQHTDKATALRQWLYQGAEVYVLKLVEEGRLSVSKAAQVLEMSVYDLHNLAVVKGVKLGATLEQYSASVSKQ